MGLLSGQEEITVLNNLDEFMRRPDIGELTSMLDITFTIEGFPHDVAMQARTHRIGTTFDVQSQRYTGKRVIDVANLTVPLESVFYLRPEGEYTNREGKKSVYTNEIRMKDREFILSAANLYADKIAIGEPEESARMILPQGIRQNFIVTFTYRALFHFWNLRLKPDAQAEISTCALMMLQEFTNNAPALGLWYSENLLAKAILAP